MKTQNNDRTGLLYGFWAYLLWGIFPLYYLLVAAASAEEVVAHRIWWTLVFSLGTVFIFRKTGELTAVLRRRSHLLRLLLAGALISVNWSIYVWAVYSGFVIDAALGYFVNPLFMVILAAFVLKERPRALQVIALAVGSSAVVVIIVWYHQIPWVALILALSFGVYGVIKKQVSEVSPFVGLSVETSWIGLVALGFLGWMQVNQTATLFTVSPLHTIALVLSGVMTALPLILFAAASSRISLTSLALLMYISPLLQFILGVTVFGEEMPLPRWIGFGLVWLALIILSVDLFRSSRRNQIEAKTPTPTAGGVPETVE
ncbi:MAG: EamA family transporter RarD [Propionibacteriaceae bacterium]|nr:EamA family transporter RarD [Propionibacteriaceae bacterium]